MEVEVLKLIYYLTIHLEGLKETFKSEPLHVKLMYIASINNMSNIFYSY